MKQTHNYFVVHTTQGRREWWTVARAPIGFDWMASNSERWCGWDWVRDNSRGNPMAKRYRTSKGAKLAMHRLARFGGLTP